MDTTNTNQWRFEGHETGYVDFERELISFDDEGSTSIDIRLTFEEANRTAYMVIYRRNNDGETRELGNQITLTWEEGLRQLEGRPDLIVHLGKLNPPLSPLDQFLKKLGEVEGPVSINHGMLWLETGESFDLRALYSTAGRTDLLQPEEAVPTGMKRREGVDFGCGKASCNECYEAF